MQRDRHLARGEGHRTRVFQLLIVSITAASFMCKLYSTQATSLFSKWCSLLYPCLTPVYTNNRICAEQFSAIQTYLRNVQTLDRNKITQKDHFGWYLAVFFEHHQFDRIHHNYLVLVSNRNTNSRLRHGAQQHFHVCDIQCLIIIPDMYAPRLPFPQISTLHKLVTVHNNSCCCWLVVILTSLLIVNAFTSVKQRIKKLTNLG